MEVINLKGKQNFPQNGTSLQGYLKVDINDIIALMGDPDSEPSGDLKVEWEWVYKIEGEVVTIYNYKDGPLYSEDENITINDITDWHVGGRTEKVIDLLREYLNQNNIECAVYAY